MTIVDAQAILLITGILVQGTPAKFSFNLSLVMTHLVPQIRVIHTPHAAPGASLRGHFFHCCVLFLRAIRMDANSYTGLNAVFGTPQAKAPDALPGALFNAQLSILSRICNSRQHARYCQSYVPWRDLGSG
jgi:hypothetical protein